MKKESVDKMSVQEVIDFIGTKLVAQGKRCMTFDSYGAPSCVYDDGEGSHCAIGFLLDKTHHSELMDDFSGSLRNLVRQHKNKLPNVVVSNVELFIQIQQFHDASLQHLALAKLKHLRSFKYTFDSKWDEFINMAHKKTNISKI